MPLLFFHVEDSGKAINSDWVMSFMNYHPPKIWDSTAMGRSTLVVVGGRRSTQPGAPHPESGLKTNSWWRRCSAALARR